MAIKKNLISSINSKIKNINSLAGDMLEQAYLLGVELHAAKAELKHGEWKDWVNENIDTGYRQCQNYLRLASGYGINSKKQPTAFLERPPAKLLEFESIDKACENLANEKKEEERKLAAKRRKEKQNKIAALFPKEKELGVYIKKVCRGKGIEGECLTRMHRAVEAEVIFKHGYEWCKTRVDEILEEELEPPDSKTKETPYLRKERIKEEKRKKAFRKERQESMAKAFAGFALGSTTGNKLYSVLVEAGPDLQKKVFKVMKMHLHPDRDTGNKELFQQLQSIEEEFNE